MDGLAFVLIHSGEIPAQGDVGFWERIGDGNEYVGSPGYLISLSGDSLPGFFYWGDRWYPRLNSIVFACENSDTLEYNIRELSGFGFMKEGVWHHIMNSLKIPELHIKSKKPRFMRRREEGKVTVYENCRLVRMQAQGYTLIANAYQGVFDFYLLRNGTVLRLHQSPNPMGSKKSFQRKMSAFMRDCPDLIALIDNYELTNLFYLVEEYNKCEDK